MSDAAWFIFNHEGTHRGPISSEALARQIQEGEIPNDTLITPEAWFEPLGASGWHRAMDVPEIRQHIMDAETKKARKLRVVPGAFSTDRRGTPDFGSTVMMVAKDHSTAPNAPPSKAPTPSKNGDES